MRDNTKEYQDQLFCYLFGSDDHKDWTLELYDAVSGTDYTTPNLITNETIQQVLCMGMMWHS